MWALIRRIGISG